MMTSILDRARPRHLGSQLLTTAQMYRADQLAIDAGIPGITLMENAGEGCADVICRHYGTGRVTVLCGTGNNGGDGFVVARLLRERGWSVRVAVAGSVDRIKGDAATALAKLPADLLSSAEAPEVASDAVADADLIVDAVFGAGLSKPVEGRTAELITAVNGGSTPVVAVDMPSGIDGTTGEIRGCAFKADRTVTFFRKKTGHLLMPGRLHCGELDLVDIGIPGSVLTQIEPMVWENGPSAWGAVLPAAQPDGHKYSRGHVVVVSGGIATTGAARLGARAALRAGAGLVTVASPPDAVSVNASHLTAIMLQPFGSPAEFAGILEDRRKNAVLVGPGCGVGGATRKLVRGALASGAGVVLDADALTSFVGNADELVEAIAEIPGRIVVATPHEGEFCRLFSGHIEPSHSKLERARMAAVLMGITIVLKGADTVIAEPSGRVLVNTNAPPTLATAGSGDVLAGLIAGLLAQGMQGFEAAGTSVWLHGEAARLFGPGLIAEDLPDLLPGVWRTVNQMA